MVLRKRTKTVPFPLDPDMRSWTDKEPSLRCRESELHHVIQHCGNFDSEFNHYIACTYAARGWYHFDDETVKTATKASIEAMEPYVLVYVGRQPTAHL
jgi:ubiquitin C-terminal hydrolase